MNFFNVGFVLLSLQFNFNWILNYVVKLVGVMFMLSGIKEISAFYSGYGKFKSGVLAVGAAAVGGTLCSALSAGGVIGESVGNVLSILFGAGSAALILVTQYKILKITAANHEIVNDPSLLYDLRKAWNKLAFFTALTVVCDVLYRLLPFGNWQTAAGTVLVFSRIIMYVYVVIMGVAFNKVRMDFNTMHPV